MATKKRVSRYNTPASEDFRKEEFPFYWLARVSAQYTQQLEKALRKVDADIPTYRVLFTLKEHGTCSVSEISLHAIAKLSTITKIVYRMKAEGLVDTSTSATDGRVTEVSLTEAGQAAIVAIEGVTERLFGRSFHGLTAAQINRFNRTLEIVFNNLSED